jgi:hypothetical protein
MTKLVTKKIIKDKMYVRHMFKKTIQYTYTVYIETNSLLVKEISSYLCREICKTTIGKETKSLTRKLIPTKRIKDKRYNDKRYIETKHIMTKRVTEKIIKDKTYVRQNV